MSATKSNDCNYIGIDKLQEQARLKAVKDGFQFNLIVAGRSGLGKTTLVKTLFKSKISPRSSDEEILPPTTEIRSSSAMIEEGGVKLRLSVTDTPGFGDQINNEHCWKPVISYIEDSYKRYLNEEQKISRPRRIADTRVHCCLYFISPGGHELVSLDVEVLSKLHDIVNLIPVIAKADSLTIQELQEFKHRITCTLNDHGIKIFPNQIVHENSDTELNDLIQRNMPLAVIGSTIWHEKNGKAVLGRQTKWGLVEVENKNHCDFYLLRNILIRTHMQELIDLTNHYHYEKFRKEYLLKQSRLEGNAKY